MDVLDLKATLGLDTSQYDKGLTGAETKAKGFGGKLKAGLGTAAKVGAATVAAVGTAAIGAGVAITKATGKVAEYGDNIDKMSQKMGMSAKAYQEWDAVLQHSGSSIEAMKPSMKTLANAAQNGAEEFQKLGISQEEVANLSQEELFAKTIEGLQNMEEGTERTAIASKLLGRGATELGALLNTSAEDTQKMKDRVNELGGVMSDEAVKASAAYQDSLQDLQTAMEGTKRNAIAKFLPGMVDVMDGLTSIFAGEQGGAEKIKKGIDNILKTVTDTAPTLFGKLKEAGKGLFSAILDNLPNITSSLVNFAVSAVKGLVNFVPAMAEAATGILSSVFHTAMQAIPKLLDSVGKMIAEGLPKLVEAGLKLIKEFAENLGQDGGSMTEAGSGLIGNLIKGIVATIPILVQYVPQIILALVAAVIKMLPSIFKAGVKIVSSLIKGIASAVAGIGKGLVRGAKDAISKVKNLNWRNLGVNIVKGIAKGIANTGGMLVRAAVNAAKNAFNKAKEFLGINSPSKLFRDVIGKNIAAGMALGIEDNEPMVMQAVSDIDSRLIEPYDEPEFIDYSPSQMYDDVETMTKVLDMPVSGSVSNDQPRDLTVVLELDRTQLARTVFRLNNEETQRVGVNLARGMA